MRLTMKNIPLFCLLLIACSSKELTEQFDSGSLFLGADLSYVNEMEDCGGVYRQDGKTVDAYQLFADKKCNLVRVRLWHTPDWTNYSNLQDVKETIRRSKDAGMEVLLDFHYSDNWADPGKQVVPEAWRDLSTETLADSMYQYTLNTLLHLNQEGLLPQMVQVGNEINSEIMVKEPVQDGQKINWTRNVLLLNKGLEAVKKAEEITGGEIQRFLHIAQPENALWWFKEAFNNNIGDFEWIGLSYYPKWSSIALSELPMALDSLKRTYQKKILIVETAYPYGTQNADSANNILGNDALITGYDASPQGQRDFMIALTNKVIEGGGEGVIYWEPAWISTGCRTRWGKGSHWDNATFFDAQDNNEVLPAFDFFDQNLYR